MARSDGDGGRSSDSSGGGPELPYKALKDVIEHLSEGDRVESDVFVDEVVVVETFDDRVPYEETVKSIEARVDLENARGDRYELTAARFTEHETVVEVQPIEGSGRTAVSRLRPLANDEQATRYPPVFERARGRTPPDPSLPKQEEWTIRTVAKRVGSGPWTDEPVPCAATGEPVDVGEKHVFVTATRDPAPHIRYSNAEHVQWVLTDADALQEWFNTSDGQESADSEDGGDQAEGV